MGMTSFVIEYICLGQEALSQATCQQILNSVTFVAFRYGHEVTDRGNYTLITNLMH